MYIYIFFFVGKSAVACTMLCEVAHYSEMFLYQMNILNNNNNADCLPLVMVPGLVVGGSVAGAVGAGPNLM